MIHAEISIYPIGTDSSSVSFYIAKAVEILKKDNIRYQITPMGTILEAESIDQIFSASKHMVEVVHNLGVNRVEVMLKIDSRIDKHVRLENKIESLKKFLDD